MTATETSFLDFMYANRDKKLLIPIYQRAYEWTTNKNKEVEKLWEDIDNIEINSNGTHFINSIVYIQDDKNSKAVNIIDGQQRTTTLSLLFIAIRDRLEAIKAESEKIQKRRKDDPILADTIRKVNNEIKRVSEYIEKYIFDEESERIGLSLSNKNRDREVYNSIVDRNCLDRKSNLFKTYNYFFTNKRVGLKKFSFTEIKLLIQKLEKVMIVAVTLDLGKDNPQTVFSSLNNGGLKLKDTDLIKNTIFMDIKDRDKQEELHSELWEVLEKGFTDKEFATFIQHYLTMKIGRVVTNNSIYEDFVNRYFTTISGESSEKVETVLKDMLFFKEIFSDLKDGKFFKDDSLLNNFSIEAYFPFLMKLKATDSVFFTKITKIIESYYVRRFVQSLPAGYTKNVFALACKDIVIDEKIEENFSKFLGDREKLQRFPKDGEFKSSFEVSPIFDDSSAITKAILFSLENSLRDNKFNDKLDKDEESDFSIEHILPQDYKSLGYCWKKDFTLLEHEAILHTIGNLTLLLPSENSSNGTKCFDEKTEIFSNSDLSLNSNLSDYDKWDKTSITDRANQLISLALQRWKSLED